MSQAQEFEAKKIYMKNELLHEHQNSDNRTLKFSFRHKRMSTLQQMDIQFLHLIMIQNY